MPSGGGAVSAAACRDPREVAGIGAIEPSRVVFQSSLVRIGDFRCRPDHPHFTDTGPTMGHCFVFPRNACWIQHEGSEPFVADANVVPVYNPGHAYRRHRRVPRRLQSQPFHGGIPAARSASRHQHSANRHWWPGGNCGRGPWRY